MSDSSYYPSGAYNDPSAPYNEVSNKEIEIEQAVTCTLHGIGTFETDEYTGDYYDEEGYEPAEYTGQERACYKVEEQMYTPIQLLEEYADKLEAELEHIKLTNPHDSSIADYEKKIESCRMWTEEEYDND